MIQKKKRDRLKRGMKKSEVDKLVPTTTTTTHFTNLSTHLSISLLSLSLSGVFSLQRPVVDVKAKGTFSHTSVDDEFCRRQTDSHRQHWCVCLSVFVCP